MTCVRRLACAVLCGTEPLRRVGLSDSAAALSSFAYPCRCCWVDHLALPGLRSAVLRHCFDYLRTAVAQPCIASPCSAFALPVLCPALPLLCFAAPCQRPTKHCFAVATSCDGWHRHSSVPLRNAMPSLWTASLRLRFAGQCLRFAPPSMTMPVRLIWSLCHALAGLCRADLCLEHCVAMSCLCCVLRCLTRPLLCVAWLCLGPV